ncbi:hypothetical protein M514_04812 [Trichuris suis]|uniref:Uncharacterized protein n=1 Tax=Trichuris suis TaxID=68888 RepID=A0A085NUN0_9BILA|nr:hypothetical protein M513_04812 [Trichuris suis]KFD73176.1 hypothetical protein M514_04812 [Trichuris suis]
MLAVYRIRIGAKKWKLIVEVRKCRWRLPRSYLKRERGDQFVPTPGQVILSKKKKKVNKCPQ